MSVLTVTLIVGVFLLLYYAGMIFYDLHMDKLSQANREDAKEQVIDISDEMQDFSAASVEKKTMVDPKSRFDTYLNGGLSIEDFSRTINSGEDAISKSLGNIYAMVEQAA